MIVWNRSNFYATSFISLNFSNFSCFWRWKKTKKTGGKIEKKNVLFPAVKTLVVCYRRKVMHIPFVPSPLHDAREICILGVHSLYYPHAKGKIGYKPHGSYLLSKRVAAVSQMVPGTCTSFYMGNYIPSHKFTRDSYECTKKSHHMFQHFVSLMCHRFLIQPQLLVSTSNHSIVSRTE